MTHPALQAVAELIRTQTMRIEYDGILTIQLRAPCLLVQLHGLVGVGAESGGRGIPGSRPTINVDAVDLWVEIVTDTAGWCQALGIDRTELRDAPSPPPLRRQPRLPWWLTIDPDRDDNAAIVSAHAFDTNRGVGRPVELVEDQDEDVHATPAVGKLLRSCAADAISRGYPQIADRIAHNATSWARRIETMLTGQTEQRAIRGATCPECAATTVVELRDEGGRQTPYRVPAITLVIREHDDTRLRWLVCNACGWNRPLGESLDETPAQAA